ncbi:MAG: hypothetical protein U0694_14900 [Anaerolineae bacterium]
MMEKPKRKNDKPVRLSPVRLMIFVGYLALLLGAGLILRRALFSGDALATESGSETLTIAFDQIEPTYTQNSYRGMVTLIISGTGQAGGTDWSDAFYLYRRGDGSAYDPPLLQHFDLEIDGQRAIETLGLLENPPAYSPDHSYTVTYDLGTQARRIAFRISDAVVGDNTGAFHIEILSE